MSAIFPKLLGRDQNYDTVARQLAKLKRTERRGDAVTRSGSRSRSG